MLNMDMLETLFYLAKEEYFSNYVAVMVSIDDIDGELIINPIQNVDYKLKYYKETYNHDLTHKHNQNIKITGIFHGDSFSDIEKVARRQALKNWSLENIPLQVIKVKDEESE